MNAPEKCPVCHHVVRGDWEWSPYLNMCYQCEKENYEDDTYGDGIDDDEDYE
jgi:hypothetical protein